MNSTATIATCLGVNVALTEFQYDIRESRVSLKITTSGKNNWSSHFMNRFIFEEVLEVDGYPLPYDPDAEDEQDLYIFEHGEAQDGIRHFSFVHSEGRAEIHIRAKGFTKRLE